MQIPPIRSSESQPTSPTPPLQFYQTALDSLKSAEKNVGREEWANYETDMTNVKDALDNVTISQLPPDLQATATQLLDQVDALNQQTLPPSHPHQLLGELRECKTQCRELIHGLGPSS